MHEFINTCSDIENHRRIFVDYDKKKSIEIPEEELS